MNFRFHIAKKAHYNPNRRYSEEYEAIDTAKMGEVVQFDCGDTRSAKLLVYAIIFHYKKLGGIKVSRKKDTVYIESI